MRISDWSSDVCSSDLDGLAARFAGRRIVAVTSHRRENFGGGMEAIARSIADIAERPDVAVIFPVHPNPHVRPVMDAVLGGLPDVAMIEPLDYPHFVRLRSEEHTSELQSLMRISYAVSCLKKKKQNNTQHTCTK